MEQTQGAEQIIVIGGGMGGLCTALALKDSGKPILILERDEPPEALPPTAAFESWKRPGVPQLRHTHIFLARFHSLLRRHHPELLAELRREVLESGTLDQLLPRSLAGHTPSQPGDEELLHLWGRRATLEYVLRRHVQRLPNVSFRHGVQVQGLVLDAQRGQLHVRGVELRDANGEQERLSAAIVVDASGVRSKSVEWLNAQGAAIRTERHPSHCAYYCRHFAQRSQDPEPPRQGTGASLDYLVFGIFFAEDNTFSIAITCPELEGELLERLRRPDGFDEICEQIPVLRTWRARAEPISRVLGGAELANRWQHFGRSQPLLGFFPVGDGYIQTNPIYGRGCSSALVQAHALADALRSERDPAARARRYHASVWKQMRPHFEFCRAADQAFLARALHAQGGHIALRHRVASALYEQLFLQAIEQSPFVARQWLKAQQMCEVDPPWKAAAVALYMVWLWLLRALSGAQKLLPRVGPVREEMLRACLPANAPRDDART